MPTVTKELIARQQRPRSGGTGCPRADNHERKRTPKLEAAVYRRTTDNSQLLSFRTMGELEKLIEAARLGIIEDLRVILHRNPELVRERDETGATALHYAAFGGHRDAVRLLVDAGADINATDAQFSATPAGWAIEYMRTMGAFLAIELSDLAYAIEKGDAGWVARFPKRFPALRYARDTQGRTFQSLAEQSGNAEIRRLMEESAG